MNNNILTVSTYGPTLPGGWSVAGIADFNLRWLPGLPAVQCKHRCHGDLVHARQRSYWVYLWSDCSGGFGYRSHLSCGSWHSPKPTTLPKEQSFNRNRRDCAPPRHLKSNLITHGHREAETAKNISKREVAIAQLLNTRP